MAPQGTFEALPQSRGPPLFCLLGECVMLLIKYVSHHPWQEVIRAQTKRSSRHVRRQTCRGEQANATSKQMKGRVGVAHLKHEQIYIKSPGSYVNPPLAKGVQRGRDQPAGRESWSKKRSSCRGIVFSGNVKRTRIQLNESSCELIKQRNEIFKRQLRKRPEGHYFRTNKWIRAKRKSRKTIYNRKKTWDDSKVKN